MMRWVLRLLAALLFIATGLNHFRIPGMYEKIMPPGFGDPHTMVAISGVCEIAGGVGLLIRRLRKPAAIGLILLLIAVYPVNIWMAIRPDLFREYNVPTWVLWARLPLQFVFIAWVWFAGGPWRR